MKKILFLTLTLAFATQICIAGGNAAHSDIMTNANANNNSASGQKHRKWRRDTPSTVDSSGTTAPAVSNESVAPVATTTETPVEPVATAASTEAPAANSTS